MKSALKIEVNPIAGLALVTTEDGVLGFPIEDIIDPAGFAYLVREDFTDTEYKYFPEELVGEVRSAGEGCWITLYDVYHGMDDATVH